MNMKLISAKIDIALVLCVCILGRLSTSVYVAVLYLVMGVILLLLSALTIISYYKEN